MRSLITGSTRRNVGNHNFASPSTSLITQYPSPPPPPPPVNQQSIIMASNGRLNGDAAQSRLKCCGGGSTRALIGRVHFKTKPAGLCACMCVCLRLEPGLADAGGPSPRQPHGLLSSSVDAVRCSLQYAVFWRDQKCIVFVRSCGTNVVSRSNSDVLLLAGRLICRLHVQDVGSVTVVVKCWARLADPSCQSICRTLPTISHRPTRLRSTKMRATRKTERRKIYPRIRLCYALKPKR